MKSILGLVSIISMALVMGACASKTKTATAEPQATKPQAAAAQPAAKVEAAPAAATPAGKVKTEKKAKKVKVQNQEPAAEAAASIDAAKVTCTSGADSRTIEIKKGEGTGCEVVYTKASDSKSVASAHSDLSFCKGVSEKVQKNLTGAGYKCQ